MFFQTNLFLGHFMNTEAYIKRFAVHYAAKENRETACQSIANHK
jgi:hypothetical protein